MNASTNNNGNDNDVMDQTTAANAISRLLQQYPDLDATASDVFESCANDLNVVYDALCQMVQPSPYVIDSDADEASQTKSGGGGGGGGGRRKFTTTLTPTALPRATKSAWAAEGSSLGRRLKAEALAQRYPFTSARAVEALLLKHGDLSEQAELEILSTYPVDEPSSFAHPLPPPTTTTSTTSCSTPTSTSTTTVVAPPSKHKVEKELYHVAHPAARVSQADAAVTRLKAEVRDARARAAAARNLACASRSKGTVARYREANDELQRLSKCLLERIRGTVEFHAGSIDLHGLTRDEAIALVDLKLDADSSSCSSTSDGSRQFEVITGKGLHSDHGRPVLKPSVEKHLRERGIPFTSTHDGVIAVHPR